MNDPVFDYTAVGLNLAKKLVVNKYKYGEREDGGDNKGQRRWPDGNNSGN